VLNSDSPEEQVRIRLQVTGKYVVVSCHPGRLQTGLQLVHIAMEIAKIRGNRGSCTHVFNLPLRGFDQVRSSSNMRGTGLPYLTEPPA
jgi:hypothetical protein